jgi:hypothetical protein
VTWLVSIIVYEKLLVICLRVIPKQSRNAVLCRLEFWSTDVHIMYVSLINMWDMPFDTICNI